MFQCDSWEEVGSLCERLQIVMVVSVVCIHVRFHVGEEVERGGFSIWFNEEVEDFCMDSGQHLTEYICWIFDVGCALLGFGRQGVLEDVVECVIAQRCC